MRRVKWILMGSLIAVLCHCQPPPPPQELFSRTQVAMGDVALTILISAPSGRSEAAYRAMGEAFSLARQIETAVSEYRPTSETSRLNRANEYTWVPIGPHLSHLLQRSQELSVLTDGRFDITYQSPALSYRDLAVSEDGQSAQWKRAGGRIGLSGIAKGYIVDRMAEHLMSLGWQDFLINAGGDIRSHGSAQEGLSPITLFEPSEGQGSRHCSISLRNRSIATSGLYARGAHIIDPYNGLPVADDWVSISVIAADTETADALATAAYASGKNARDSLLRWIQQGADITAILIDHEGRFTTLTGSSPPPEITCQALNADSKNEIPMELFQ